MSVGFFRGQGVEGGVPRHTKIHLYIRLVAQKQRLLLYLCHETNNQYRFLSFVAKKENKNRPRHNVSSGFFNTQ